MRIWIGSAIIAVVGLSLMGCDQWMARSGFGKQTVKLACNTKLENITWKSQNAELWMLTRPFRAGEKAEAHNFKASTLFGVFEGEVIIQETAC